MINSKKNYTKEYLLTFLMTLFFVFSIAFCVELELMFRCEQKVNFDELNMKNLSKFCTIEQLENLLKKEPSNSVVSIKIANIYDSLDEVEKANFYYKNALNISGHSNFSLYSYALFCAKRHFFNLSTALVEEMSGNTIKVFEYKTKIYEAIGDSLLENEQFEASSKAFQISYKYAKSINDKKYLSKIALKYANSYVKIADILIDNKNTQEAVVILKKSLQIKPTTQAKYKLALLYRESNPKEAERLLAQVLRENPYILNPYIYNSLLEDLIKKASFSSKNSDEQYYIGKLKRFRDSLKRAYLYKDDIKINNLQLIKKKNLSCKQSNFYLVYEIKNNTSYEIENLYMRISFILGSKKAQIEKKVVSYPSKILPFSQMSDVKIHLDSNEVIELLNQKADAIGAVVKFEAKKDKQAPWVLLEIKQLNR